MVAPSSTKMKLKEKTQRADLGQMFKLFVELSKRLRINLMGLLRQRAQKWMILLCNHQMWLATGGKGTQVYVVSGYKFI
ncbi:hypothetical protein Nepgr_020712 [Nepenthes gracilis]|uniref:Uncharacterized protein n=1 Tax=Nepenthes gracilis TaxID=150966 RepID=A0AAD3XWN1_NEPGR|nr:hypothetical protein Nepgr_020712 [Nepenthes gracilis]